MSERDDLRRRLDSETEERRKLVAILTDRLGKKRETAYKAMIFVPMAISGVAAAVTWRFIYDYKAPGRDHFAWQTTIGDQRRDNVHVHAGVEEREFVALREARDKTLDMPRLILPSVQVNIRGGRLPEPEDNGVRYLKIPLNAI